MTMPPALFPPIPTGEGGQRLSGGELNSRRVEAVVQRLVDVSRSVGGGQAALFSNLCVSLARGLDFAISNDEKPHCASSLPYIMNLVCMHQKDFARQPAIMVLLFSVKNACKKGWFPSKETEELLALVDQVGRSFSTSGDLVADQRTVIPVISQIISRFYPRLKLGHIFVSLEVKAGFGAYVVDFLISKSTPHNGNEKIKLLVAVKDNIETSNCILSPNKVNFLLNGKPVDGRTNVSGDQGPQPPTMVEPILKYGTNLLQVLGQFEGNCVILLAFMSTMAISELPTPQNYVQPARIVPDSDDVMEGPSRISLLCPISLVRIKTPAKGHMCRHHQCFDLTCYIQINTKRPSWRCPHCNQAVCYTDIRIDQNMLKILQEFEENIVEVILSEDGSWKAVHNSDDENNNLDGPVSVPEGAEQQEKPSGHYEIYDISDGDDDNMYAHGPVDTKPNIQSDLGKALGSLVSSAPNQGHECFQSSCDQPELMNLQRQAQSIVSTDYRGRRNFTRHASAIMGLPAQLPTSNANSCPPFGNHAGNHPSVSTTPPSMPLQSSAGGTVSSSDLLQQPYIESLLRQRQSSQVGTTPGQVSQTGFEDSSNHRVLHQTNPMMPPVVSPSPTISCPPHLRNSRPQMKPMVSTVAMADHQIKLSSQQSLGMGSSAQQLASRPRQPNLVPVQMARAGAGDRGPGSAGGVQSVTRTEDLLDIQAEQNWRPSGAGRMRGSIAGRALSNGLDQSVILPTHMGGLTPPSSGRPALSQRPNTAGSNTMGLTPPSSSWPSLSHRPNTVAPHLSLLANMNAISSLSPGSGMGPSEGTGGK